METTQTTPPVTAGNNLLDELKTWATSENNKASNVSKPFESSKPPESTKPFETSKPIETPGVSGSKIIADTDFLNTGGHTQTPPLSNAGTPGSPTTPTPSTQTTKKILASSGKFAATLIHEMAIPALAVWLLSRFKKTVNKDGFKITKDEKEILTEAWNEYLASLNISIDKPIYQLLLAIGFVYGSKLADGSIKIEDMKATPATVKGSLIEQINTPIEKVTKENFDKFFEQQKEKLIDETRGKIRKNRAGAIKWITDRREFIKLEKTLRDRYNIPA